MFHAHRGAQSIHRCETVWLHFLESCHTGGERASLNDRPARPAYSIQESDLHRVRREALPVHIHTMPAIQMDSLVARMANSAACVYLSAPSHATPGGTACSRILSHQPVVIRRADPHWVGRGDHNGDTELPHQLFAKMRLAATAAAE